MEMSGDRNNSNLHSSSSAQIKKEIFDHTTNVEKSEPMEGVDDWQANNSNLLFSEKQSDSMSCHPLLTPPPGDRNDEENADGEDDEEKHLFDEPEAPGTDAQNNGLSLASATGNAVALSHCPPEWMGDLNSEWDQEFIKHAFGAHSDCIRLVKLVNDKSGQKATYCFVEFIDEHSARNAYVEYNLFVSNLHPDIDDIALFRLFGERYKTCRGAKVHQDHDGISKEHGFVRFTSETDQQQAFIELNKHKIKGRELILKLAPPRSRGGPRSQRGGGPTGNFTGGGSGGGGNHYSGRAPAQQSNPFLGTPLVGGGIMTGPGGAFMAAAPQTQFYVQGPTGFVPLIQQQSNIVPMPLGMVTTSGAQFLQPFGGQANSGGDPSMFHRQSGYYMNQSEHGGEYHRHSSYRDGSNHYESGGHFSTGRGYRGRYRGSFRGARGRYSDSGSWSRKPYYGYGGGSNNSGVDAMLQMGASGLGSTYDNEQSLFLQQRQMQSEPVVPVLEDTQPLSAEEHNEMMMRTNADFHVSLEASRWGPVYFPPDARRSDIRQTLNAVFYSNAPA